MKFFLIFVFLLLFSSQGFSFDRTYNVSGVTEDDAVQGVAYNNPADDSQVYGQLTDSEGLVHSFEGNWSGAGRITGETDDGDEVELNIK